MIVCIGQTGSGRAGAGRSGGWSMNASIGRICFAAGIYLAIAAVGAGQNIIVDATPSHVANSFSPFRALGAAIDRLRAPGGGRGAANPTAPRKATREEIEKHVETILGGQPLKEILGAGWQTVSYRQNTELHIEAWHWNPKGVWSDPSGQGYFTGNATPGALIRHP